MTTSPEAARERQRAYSRAYYQRNKARSKELSRLYYAKHPGHNTRRTRMRNGWSDERVQEFMSAQEGCCAICGDAFNKLSREPHADHSHTANEPRGLLCAKCNVGIAQFLDDPHRLELAIDYLTQWSC